ncbi:hypothetical protein J6590_029804 [Homalodisca vitripennis]|nr:hypothetical protein J6590_029804 [Homalodisca vitripennis]
MDKISALTFKSSGNSWNPDTECAPSLSSFWLSTSVPSDGYDGWASNVKNEDEMQMPMERRVCLSVQKSNSATGADTLPPTGAGWPMGWISERHSHQICRECECTTPPHFSNDQDT